MQSTRNFAQNLLNKFSKPVSIPSAIILILMAVFLTQFIQIRTGNPAFITENPILFAYSAFVIALVIVFFSFLAKNLFLGFSIFTAILIGLTFGDANKYFARVEHTFPADFVTITNIGGMSSMYSQSALIAQIIFIVAVLAVGFALKRLCVKRREKTNEKSKIPKSKKWLIRIGLALLTAVVIFMATIPFHSSDEAKAINFTYKPWNQIDNFNDNGYVAAFISNFRNPFPEPEGYSEARIKEIAQKYESIAEEENKNRIDLSNEDVDIVFVMNESFTDVDSFKNIYPFEGGAVTPNLDAIKAKSLYGNISSPQYGGGTSNVEFEALTGLSMYYLGVTIPFQDTIPGKEDFVSLPNLLANQYGYETLALHPYIKSLYSRAVVYPNLGFDEFFGEDDFSFVEKDRTSWYISDESSYKELEQALDNSKGNIFVHLVTMQNHQLYGDQYEEHGFKSQADTTEAERARISDYMELLHDSDAALKDLIDMVDNRSKKTMVVFWGDHLPGVYPELLESEEGLAFTTPFFIYSNFEGEKGDAGKMSPNYISTVTLDYLNAKKSPFYYLLDAMKRGEPAFTGVYFSGNYPDQTEILSDYEMIEYDLLRGKGYSTKLGMFEIG